MGDWADLLPRAGQGSGIPEFAINALNAQSQRSQNDAQTQLIQAQTQAAQTAAMREQQFAQRVSAITSETDPAKQTKLISDTLLMFPEQKDAIKASWDIKDGAAKKADLGWLGETVAAFDANKPDLALANIQRRRDADAAAGFDTKDDDSWIEAVKSKDPKAIAYVRGAMLAHIGAADPERFAQNYTTASKPGSPFNRSPGQETIDPITNTVTGKTAFAPRVIPVTQPDGSIKYVEYQPGGGDLTSSPPGRAPNGATSGRTQYGWTPRARNGGDNPDKVVDNKIAGMVGALGVAADDSLVGKSPLEIAKALTLSEGGPGSLADRNNNPGNITDGKGGYRKFPTKEAGLAAAAAQVARNLRRGQTTIRTMVEGLPVGGQSAAPQTGGGALGTRVIAVGAPKPGTIPTDAPPYQPGTPVGGMSGDAIDRAAQRYNMTGVMPVGLGRRGDVQRAILSRAAQLANGDTGSQIGDQAGRKADTSALVALETKTSNVMAFERGAVLNGTIALRLSDKVGNGGVPIWNKWVNAGRRETGDPDVAAFNAAVTTFADEYSKIVTTATGGGAGTSDSARQHVYNLINTAQSPAQFRSVMSVLRADMTNRRRGIEQERAAIQARISGNAPSSGGGAGSSPSTAIPVRSAQEAKRYSGKFVRTPDGRVGRAR